MGKHIRSGLVKAFLYALIASVVVLAGMAIYVLLFSDFEESETAGRILLTSGTASLGLLLAMACAAPWDRPALRWLSVLALLLTIAATAMLIHAIWSELRDYPGETLGVLWVWAVAVAFACLLLLARPAGGLVWVLVAALAVTFCLAMLLTLMIVDVVEDWEHTWRAVGVLAVLAGAGAVTVPLCHRLSMAGRQEKGAQGPAGAPPEVAVLCPQCGERTVAPLGDITCAACGCAFHVTLLSRGRANDG
jgi:hypothetical protein